MTFWQEDDMTRHYSTFTICSYLLEEGSPFEVVTVQQIAYEVTSHLCFTWRKLLYYLWVGWICIGPSDKRIVLKDSPSLLGNLAGDFIGPHWILNCWFLVAEVWAHEHKGDGDAKPQETKCKQCCPWHGSWRLLSPDQHVQCDEDAEADARKEQRYLQCRLLPLFPLHL